MASVDRYGVQPGIAAACSNQRVVKRKMSNYNVKRPAHHDWSQPTRPAGDAATITPAPP